jgi:hypothetical protein
MFVCFPGTGDPESVAGEYGRHSLYKMLGYFSLVGLLRLHSLLGDYYQAIKVLENIELNKKVEPKPLSEGPHPSTIRVTASPLSPPSLTLLRIIFMLYILGLNST